METVNEITAQLSARSRTASLDELRSEGRKHVRLIRAEHIAEMVSRAVHSAIEGSGLIDPDKHEELVEQSRREFKAVLAEHQVEVKQAREVAERLENRTRELEDIKHRFQELSESLTAARGELKKASGGSDGLRDEIEQAREALTSLQAEAQSAKDDAEEARADAEQARADAEQARAEVEEAKNNAGDAEPAPGNEMMMSLFQEIATMKASMQQPPAVAPGEPGEPAVPAAPAAPAAAGADLTAAMEKLTSSLNDRLETLGRKMGVSSAVDSDTPVDFSSMFKDLGDDVLESNMTDIKVKQKSAGGIAANLARLKKLKGG